MNIEFSLSLYLALFFTLSSIRHSLSFLLYKCRDKYTKARLIILIDVITSSLCRRIASSLHIPGTAHYCRYYQESSFQTACLPTYPFLFGSSSFFSEKRYGYNKKTTEPSIYLYSLYLYIYLLERLFFVYEENYFIEIK